MPSPICTAVIVPRGDLILLWHAGIFLEINASTRHLAASLFCRQFPSHPTRAHRFGVEEQREAFVLDEDALLVARNGEDCIVRITFRLLLFGGLIAESLLFGKDLGGILVEILLHEQEQQKRNHSNQAFQ